MRALGEKLSRRRESEREVCARAGRETEQTQRERERCVHAEQSRRTHREREREVCARAGRARPRACAAVPVILRN